jgi:farnesol dehydrogenase
MIDWYLQGKWRVVLGDGDMVGNYVFVDDLIDGYLRAMNYGKAGERYILGGENVSFDEFFDVLSEVSGRRFRMFHLPARIARLFARIEEWRSRHLRHYPMITPGWAETFLANWANSCNKAKRNLGYRVTPLRSAFEQAIKWLQEQSASPTVAA